MTASQGNELSRMEKAHNDIKRILIIIRNQENHPTLRKQTFHLEDFPPAAIDSYAYLQHEMATLIKNEENRPTIVLHICGKERRDKDDRPDIGFIGGIGPLSDAKILRELIRRRLKEEPAYSSSNDESWLDHFHAILWSFPPPRQPQASYLWQATTTAFYLYEFYQFCQLNCKQYMLLSNSAHAYAEKIEKLLPYTSQFVHLVKHIASSILSTSPTSILVLGTTAGVQSRVYASQLSSVEKVIVPTSDEQHQIQNGINKIKAGGAKDIQETFFPFLIDLISRTKTSHVLLGCTEIPLFLHYCYDSQEKELITVLKEKFPEIHFVDSENEIITAIHQNQLTLECESRERLESDNLELEKTLFKLRR